MNEENIPSSPIRLTLKDVAARLGISKATVCLALKGDQRVSKATVQKVEMAVKEMGYRPDPMLSALSRYAKSGYHAFHSTIAYVGVSADLSSQRAMETVNAEFNGMDLGCEETGYAVNYFSCPTSSREWTQLEKNLAARGIRGVLLDPYVSESKLPDSFANAFLCCFVGEVSLGRRLHSLTTNHFVNAFRALQTASQRGYQKPMLVYHASTPAFQRIQLGAALNAAFPQTQDPGGSYLWSSVVDPKPFLENLKNYSPDLLIYPGTEWIHELLESSDYAPKGLVVLDVQNPDSNVTGIFINHHELGRQAIRLMGEFLQKHMPNCQQQTSSVLIGGQWIEGSTLPDLRK
jgi:DNA-binding LacI/PurR family transcriptional regulator